MLQLQYYNTKLTKTHIDGILNNYNIKYKTEKREIEAKLDNLIKIVMGDILSFLENIEEISKERKKIKEFENLQKEYDILSSKMKEKTLNEHQLESEIESLQKEILFLKNENKNQVYKKIEMKTPSTAKSKTPRKIFDNKKHVKMKSDYLTNKTFMNDSSKINVLAKRKKNSSKYNSKKKNTSKNNVKNISLSVTRRKIGKKTNDNNKDEMSHSPDLVAINRKKILNNSNKIDKTIEKIKKYTINKNNERIRKIQNFKFIKKNNKLKRIYKNNDSEVNNLGNNLTEYKKNSQAIRKKESLIDDDLDNNKTYEHAQHILNLIDSNPEKNKKKENNYSADDESKMKSISSNSSSSSSESSSEEINTEEIRNIDNEIKELQEDEDNILLIINQIKELNINSYINPNS